MVSGHCPERWLKVKLCIQNCCKSITHKAALDGSKQELHAKGKTHGHTATSVFRHLFVLMKNLKYPQFLIFPLQMYILCSPRSTLGSREVGRRAIAPLPLQCQLAGSMAVSIPGLRSSLLHASYSELWFCNCFDFKLFILMWTGKYAFPMLTSHSQDAQVGPREVVEPLFSILDWASSWKSRSNSEAWPALSWKRTTALQEPFLAQIILQFLCRDA